MLKLAGDDFAGTGGFIPRVTALLVAGKEVKLKVLVDVPEWSVISPGANNGLLVISGQPGSGDGFVSIWKAPGKA